MAITVDIEKCLEEKIDDDVKRFMELSDKYKDNIDEILEFVDICNRIGIHRTKNKYVK
jgi:hypothetical protein